MPAQSDDRARAELSEAFDALTRVNEQLTHATEGDVRVDLLKVKKDLQERIAELGRAVLPAPTRAELEAELAYRERQLNDVFKDRINTMTQTSGDGAAPGGYGVGAQEINEAIDLSHDRAGIERRIRELWDALDALEDD